MSCSRHRRRGPPPPRPFRLEEGTVRYDDLNAAQQGWPAISRHRRRDGDPRGRFAMARSPALIAASGRFEERRRPTSPSTPITQGTDLSMLEDSHASWCSPRADTCTLSRLKVSRPSASTPCAREIARRSADNLPRVRLTRQPRLTPCTRPFTGPPETRRRRTPGLP